MAQKSDIGLIGLAVMGENLVLNMESKGFRVSVFNRTVEKVDKFINGRGAGKNFYGAHSLEDLVASTLSMELGIPHLVARLLKFKYVEAQEDMTLDEVKANLGYRFREINYQEAKRDLLPFIENPQELDVWSVDYFLSITQWLTAQ